MEAKKVRWAVVGHGNVLLPDDARLVARVAANGTYDELERVIEEAGVETVYVALPSSLHREMAERAARAGANVICEEPMAATSEDCVAMIEACEDAGVELTIAYRLRFEGELEAIEPHIFTAIVTREVEGGDVRGGALLDMGIHCIRAARRVFGAEPLSVLAMQTAGAEERSRHVDATTSVVMRFPDDRIAQLTVSHRAPRASEVRVIGAKGVVELAPSFALDIASSEEGLADVRVIEAIVRSAATREVVHVEGAPRSSRPSWPAAERPMRGRWMIVR